MTLTIGMQQESLGKILAELQKRPATNLADVLAVLASHHYVGTVDLHYQDGVPRMIEFGKIRLVI